MKETVVKSWEGVVGDSVLGDYLDGDSIEAIVNIIKNLRIGQKVKIYIEIE